MKAYNSLICQRYEGNENSLSSIVRGRIYDGQTLKEKERLLSSS